jgi:hypothetical protein
MANKTLEAQLIINAQDKTAAGLDAVVKRINGVTKKIEDFRKVQSRFTEARGKFQQAQKTVEAAARAMSGMDKPTREVASAYKTAQRAASEASRVFEAQKTTLLGAKRELETYGVEVTRLAAAENRLKSAAEQASASQEHQARSAARWQKLRTGAAGVAATGAGFYAGHLAKEGYSEAVKATAEGAHERVRMETAGMTPDEIREAEEASAKLSGQFTSVGQTKILHLLRNARSIVGTYEEAGKIIEPLLQTYVVAQGAHPDRADELGEDFDKLVKGMEIKGVTQDLPKFKHYLDSMSKALNVFGDTLRPTDYYEMFKYGRQSTQGLSDKFMLETAPTFAQEMGGSSAGKAFSSFFQAVVGGRMKQGAIQTLEKYNLVDPTKVIKTSTGATKGLMPGGVIGADIARSDPYAWVNQVFLPALAKKGVTDPQAIAEIISTSFQAGTAAQLVQILATQQPRIEKDWNLIEHAKGSEAAGTFQAKDPYIALKSVTEQFNNLLQAAGSPLAESAAAGLNHIASGLVTLTESAREHPTAASTGLLATVGGGAIAGWSATLGLASRFGLISPATAAAGYALNAPVAFVAGTGLMAAAEANYAKAHPEALQGLIDTPSAGMIEGDLALGQAILNQSRQPRQDKVNVVVEVKPADGFWAKVASIWVTPDSAVTATGTTGSVGKSMPEAAPTGAGGR